MPTGVDQTPVVSCVAEVHKTRFAWQIGEKRARVKT
jgi:hypothetical protein